MDIEAGDSIGVTLHEVGAEIRPALDLKSAWQTLTRDKFNPTVFREGERLRRTQDGWHWRRW